MDKFLKDLLDKTYELEGLLHLALKRNDSIEEFIRLISKKGKDIAGICENIKETSGKSRRDTKISDSFFSLEEYSIDEETEPAFPSAQLSLTDLKKENKNDTERGKLVFSINDKFRFRKELFNNSDIDFNNTVALIASMEDYEEAEDYFINEEGFDANDQTVKDFLGFIQRYFS